MRWSMVLVVFCSVGVACGDDDRGGDAGGVDSGELDANLDASGADVGSDARMPDASDVGGGDVGSMPAIVNLTFAGACDPDFTHEILTSYDGRYIEVLSREGGDTQRGAISFALEDLTGTVSISTMHRNDTGFGINVRGDLLDVWTNFSATNPDPISGTVRIDDNRSAEGMVDVTLTAVMLKSPDDDSICQVDGRVQIFEIAGFR